MKLLEYFVDGTPLTTEEYHQLVDLGYVKCTKLAVVDEYTLTDKGKEALIQFESMK